MSNIINNSSIINNNSSEIVSHEILRKESNKLFNNFSKIKLTSTNKENSLNSNIETVINSSLKNNNISNEFTISKIPNDNNNNNKINININNIDIKKNLFNEKFIPIENKENFSIINNLSNKNININNNNNNDNNNKILETKNSIQNNNNNNNKNILTNSNENKIELNNKNNNNNNKNLTNLNNNKNLFQFLKSIELECYFNSFIQNNINLTNKTLNKSFLQQTLGIKKIGHIYRILTKIELENGKISKEIKNILFNIKKPIAIKNGKEILLLYESIEKEKKFFFSCGICNLFKNIFNNNNNNNFDYFKRRRKIFGKKFILDYWLKKNKIFYLKKNFVENGFEYFEYFILQMFTNFPINDKILKEEMNIKNCFDREIILIQLNKDVKYIKRNINENNNNFYL